MSSKIKISLAETINTGEYCNFRPEVTVEVEISDSHIISNAISSIREEVEKQYNCLVDDKLQQLGLKPRYAKDIVNLVELRGFAAYVRCNYEDLPREWRIRCSHDVHDKSYEWLTKQDNFVDRPVIGVEDLPNLEVYFYITVEHKGVKNLIIYSDVDKRRWDDYRLCDSRLYKLGYRNWKREPMTEVEFHQFVQGFRVLKVEELSDFIDSLPDISSSEEESF